MTCALRFHLPAERAEFMRAARAQDLALLLWEHDQYLRNRLKHGELHPEAVKALQESRDFLRQENAALWEIVEAE